MNLTTLLACAAPVLIGGAIVAMDYPPGAYVIATDPPIVYVPNKVQPYDTNEPVRMLPLTPPPSYPRQGRWLYGNEPTYPQIVLLRTYLTTNVVAEHWIEESYRPGFKSGNWEGGGLVYTPTILIPATTNILTNYVLGYTDGTNLVEAVTTVGK